MDKAAAMPRVAASQGELGKFLSKELLEPFKGNYILGSGSFGQVFAATDRQVG